MKHNALLHHSLNYVYWGGIATSAKDTLAVGPTLTAYALLFGAGNFAIGLLGAVPFIGNLIHLLVAYLIERGVTVKKIAVICKDVQFHPVSDKPIHVDFIRK